MLNVENCATPAAEISKWILTLVVSAHEASLLQAVVVVPESVRVHLHAVLINGAPGVEGCVGLSRCPVEEAQRRLVRPGPAN